jgi:hypothetical protein
MGVMTLPERFVRRLRELKYEQRGRPREVLGLRVLYIDLSKLRLRFSDRSPFIEIPGQELRQHPPERIMATLRDIVLQLQVQDRIPVVLLDGRSFELRRLANKPPYYMIVLDSEDMRQVIESRTPSDELLARIRYQVPLSFLSPYEASAPVTDSMFFGREYEIRTILSHPNTCYAIIGTRRIGKTSVLKELKRRMEMEEPDSKRFLYVDCMSFTDMQAFFEQIISRLHPKEQRRLWRMGASYAGYFPRFMERMKAMRKGRIVFFLDEFDHLLKFDREKEYALMKALRASFQEGSCRLIFSGFREAQRELADPGSPFNFTSTLLTLSNLKYSQAADLIESPMDSLGVKIVSRDQVIQRIYKETAGHPNFIQHYCLTLMRDLDDEGTRVLTPEHLTRLADDESFRVRVLETFIFNTNDLEKAVAYAVSDREQFSVEDVDRQMKRRRIFIETRHLEDACRKLEALGVWHRTGNDYQFAIPVFPQLLRERYGGEFLFAKAKEHIKLRMQRGRYP